MQEARENGKRRAQVLASATSASMDLPSEQLYPFSRSQSTSVKT
jgi:hypothetical protein